MILHVFYACGYDSNCIIKLIQTLYKENMLVIIKKYKFYIKKTDFIGFIIKLRQINIDLKKIKAIIN